MVNDNDDDSENTVLESDIFKTADDPLPYETKVLLIDYHNGKTSELPSGWISGVGYTAADDIYPLNFAAASDVDLAITL